MQNAQTDKGAEHRIRWGKSFINFAIFLWSIATLLGVPVMLMKVAYWLSSGSGNVHSAADAAMFGVMFGIVFMFLLGTCIEKVTR